ncbi:MAG: hypothetical protein E6G13_10195 [Actinobacteria bacterium]|nr:MAG: hypothetical protein E6G13_10195 [Actinomycetota bacterium]
MIRPLVLVLVALAWPAAASAAPIRSAIFFYPWYSTATHDGGYAHWQQGSHTPPWDIGSVYFPARGAYSSADPHVLVAQMRDIRRARVDEVVSSWWGPGSPEDDRLPMIRRIARREGLNLAIQLEPYRGRSIASIGQDLAYLRGLGIHDVYVYRSEDFPAEAWATLPLKLSGVRTFAQTSRIGFAAKAGFDGFYTYDILVYGGDKFARLCAEAHAVKLLCAPSVGPGYDAEQATGDPNVKPRDNGATYDTMWRAAVAAGADLVTITSYNEWSEGTQIEPAGHGGRYESYAGAYGLRGRAAPYAYLRATRRWTDRFRDVRRR